MSFQKIDIDFDIYKCIENERKSFDEPPYIALRRLLNLEPISDFSHKHTSEKTLKAFIEGQIEIPNGTEARMYYQRNTQKYDGMFYDGKLVINGKGYNSLSAAANDLAITKDGSKTSLNGWNYWELKFPNSSEWIKAKDYREKKLKKLGLFSKGS